MSNTPLSDVRCEWTDGTILKYSLDTGKTSIQCPQYYPKGFLNKNKLTPVFSDDFNGENEFNLSGENSSKYGNFSHENNFNKYTELNYNGNEIEKEFNKNIDNNEVKNKSENKNLAYWEGELSNWSDPGSGIYGPGSGISGPGSPYSPTSTTYCQSVDLIDLNPVPKNLKTYLEISQKIIKIILKEENKINFSYSRTRGKNLLKNKKINDNSDDENDNDNGNSDESNNNNNSFDDYYNKKTGMKDMKKINSSCRIIFIDHL